MALHLALFTWNPTKFNWTPFSKPGETHRWNTRSQLKNKAGDRFILLRTGKDHAGIVAFGTIDGDPYQAPESDGKEGWFVNLRFEGIIENAQAPAIVERDELVESFPSVKPQTWIPHTNGIEFKDEAVVEALWARLSERESALAPEKASEPAPSAEASEAPAKEAAPKASQASVESVPATEPVSCQDEKAEPCPCPSAETGAEAGASCNTKPSTASTCCASKGEPKADDQEAHVKSSACGCSRSSGCPLPACGFLRWGLLILIVVLVVLLFVNR